MKRTCIYTWEKLQSRRLCESACVGLGNPYIQMSSGKQNKQKASIHRAHENARLTSLVYYKILSSSRIDTFLPEKSKHTKWL